MKQLLISIIPALVCLCLLFAPAYVFGGCFSYYCAFDQEKAVVVKNGADIGGRVFTKTYDPEPDTLLIIAGDSAFMLKTKGLFLQQFGPSNVADITVNGIDDTAKPVTIDYEAGAPMAGVVLEETGESEYSFTVGSDRYEVRLKKPVTRDPAMFTSLRGYLTSRPERVGTRSEGPEYYLKLEDGRQIHIVKNVLLWQEDPALQKMVGVEVWALGALVDGELVYKTVGPNLK